MVLQNISSSEFQAAIERGLAAEPQHDRVRAFACNHLLDELRGNRQKVNPIGEPSGGLDSRDIGVDQYRSDSFFLQRLDGLAARVVELPRFAYLEGAAPENENLGGHCAHWILLRKRSKRCSESTGPGAPSGWNCTPRNGRVRCRIPSFDPSLAFVNHGSHPSGNDAGSTAKPWFCDVMRQR